MDSRRRQLITSSLLAAVAVSALLSSDVSARPSAAPLFLGKIVQMDLRLNGPYPKVSAYRGRLAWSDYDSATDRWVLMTRANGRVRQVPVAPRAGGPFDVDLGPNASGNTAAVYSRCTAGKRGFVGCDIYEFDFRRHKETAVSAVNTSRSEFLPSIWKTKIAFARRCRGTPRCKRVWASVHLVDTHERGSSKRISPPPRRYEEDPLRDASPGAVELRGKRVAYSWNYGYSESGKSQLRLYGGRRSRALFTTYWAQGAAEGAKVGSPSFDNRHTLYFAEMNSDASQIVRYSLATKRLRSTAEGHGYATFDLQVAWLNRRLVAAKGIKSRHYGIYRLSTPKFKRRR